MPMLAMKDDRTNVDMATVVQNKGIVDYGVGAVKKMIEQLGYIQEGDSQERP